MGMGGLMRAMATVVRESVALCPLILGILLLKKA
jgi:hypothetical protein